MIGFLWKRICKLYLIAWIYEFNLLVTWTESYYFFKWKDMHYSVGNVNAVKNWWGWVVEDSKWEGRNRSNTDGGGIRRAEWNSRKLFITKEFRTVYRRKKENYWLCLPRKQLNFHKFIYRFISQHCINPIKYLILKYC